MESVKKVTKKEYYVMLKEVVENSNSENKDLAVSDIVDNQTISILNGKLLKA